jgi:hypothetical protein
VAAIEESNVARRNSRAVWRIAAIEKICGTWQRSAASTVSAPELGRIERARAIRATFRNFAHGSNRLMRRSFAAIENPAHAGCRGGSSRTPSPAIARRSLVLDGTSLP